MTATRLKERPETSAEYEQDFYAWTIAQVSALRARRIGELDIEHLAEEIECLGNEQFSKVRSHFRIILLHMLKWDHQPTRRTRSWTISIADHRFELDDVLVDNPSLRPRQMEAIARAYRRARVEAARETRLSLKNFPESCPYSLDDILTRPFDWSAD